MNYKVHRIIWLHVNGYTPERDIDHINRDRSDNRISNLREVSTTCNLRNTGNWRHNTSGVKGVSWVAKRAVWRSQIGVLGKVVSLGYHKCFIEAVAHRFAAEQCLLWHNCDSNSPAYLHLASQLI